MITLPLNGERGAQPKEQWSRAADNGSPAQPALNELLYLLGRPTLKQFLKVSRDQEVNSPGEGVLTQEWNAAAECIRELEETEKGAADSPSMRKLGAEYEPLLIELLKDPLIRHGFNTVPTDIALVELDHLVVHQKDIDLTFVRQFQKRLEGNLSQEEIFRICLPYDHPSPPVKWAQIHSDKFVVVSPSTDLRFLGRMTLAAENITNYPPPGALSAVLGLAVGFGCNFLNAVYAEKRLILNNGSHRAYALRALGITHVPCIIEHVSSREELEVLGASEVRRNPDGYLKHARPPMLKDYFNPKLHKIFSVPRRLRQITIKFEVDESSIPAV